MGVELFVTPEGLIVIARRVHNSGHWTQNGCAVDQFEQQHPRHRGLATGQQWRHADVVMENLIGDDIARVPSSPANATPHSTSTARPRRDRGARWGT